MYCGLGCPEQFYNSPLKSSLAVNLFVVDHVNCAKCLTGVLRPYRHSDALQVASHLLCITSQVKADRLYNECFS